MREPLPWNTKVKLAVVSPDKKTDPWRKLRVIVDYLETGWFRPVPDMNYFTVNIDKKNVIHDDVYGIASMLFEVSQADMVLFLDGWESDMGCSFIHSICKAEEMLIMSESEGKSKWLNEIENGSENQLSKPLLIAEAFKKVCKETQRTAEIPEKKKPQQESPKTRKAVAPPTWTASNFQKDCYASIRDTRKITGLPEKYIREGIKSGKFPHIMSGNKALVNPEEILKIVNKIAKGEDISD